VQNAYHPFVEEQSLIPETTLYTVYLDGSYELADSVEAFGEFLFNRRKTYQNGWRQFWQFGTTGDYYGDGSFGTIWADGFSGANLLSPTAITNHADSSQRVDYYRGVGGLRGDFGSSSDWRWEGYVQYSKSIGRYRTEQILQDAYDTGSFQTSSCVGTVTPVSGRQCIDVRWADPNFLAGELTPEEVGFLFDWEEGRTTYSQLTGEATVNGTLYELPAGPLALAAGVTVRQDKINDTPGEITLAGNVWGNTTSGITAGKSLTTEAFAELNVPILADQDFFRELTLSAAGRVTNVKATRASDGVSAEDNGNFTYKVGLNWAVTDGLRFRGSYGTSFRAPALFEQFLTDETSFPTQRDIDICVNWGANLAAGLISQRVADNCGAGRPDLGLIGVPANHPGGGATATSVAQGGLGELAAETSRAWVVGTVLTPTFSYLPNTTFSLAIDYFDIKVKGEITQLGASNIIFGCYDSENFGSEPLCELFSRGQNGAPVNINEVFDKFVNIASQRNAGVDVALSIRHDFGKMGDISFNADMTWQTKDDFQLLPTSEVTSDNGEAGSPKWIGDFRLSWDTPWHDVSIFYGVNIIGPTSDFHDWIDANQDSGAPNGCIDSSLRGVYCPDLTAPTRFYHNISVTAPITDIFELTVGVSNLFDARPPRVSVLNGGEIQMIGPVISASQYPFVGRRAFANLSAKF
jgi:iron complex outermembrane receptor protein